ncbi:hypothetical protein CSIM01_03913 [Colletotrichum simmondsii]|uniref:Uncharacterized protein n=1 Tax=Colletotrichum simmondsii TaxID=703756 RepID=A0A135TNK3_9PEZI|nr:hypothetical protein CSIM01_03913 [Colletotrichum simmondsii]
MKKEGVTPANASSIVSLLFRISIFPSQQIVTLDVSGYNAFIQFPWLQRFRRTRDQIEYELPSVEHPSYSAKPAPGLTEHRQPPSGASYPPPRTTEVPESTPVAVPSPATKTPVSFKKRAGRHDRKLDAFRGRFQVINVAEKIKELQQLISNYEHYMTKPSDPDQGEYYCYHDLTMDRVQHDDLVHEARGEDYESFNPSRCGVQIHVDRLKELRMLEMISFWDMLLADPKLVAGNDVIYDKWIYSSKDIIPPVETAVIRAVADIEFVGFRVVEWPYTSFSTPSVILLVGGTVVFGLLVIASQAMYRDWGVAYTAAMGKPKPARDQLVGNPRPASKQAVQAAKNYINDSRSPVVLKRGPAAKYYVVYYLRGPGAHGRKYGIFTDWNETKKQTEGCQNKNTTASSFNVAMELLIAGLALEIDAGSLMNYSPAHQRKSAVPAPAPAPAPAAAPSGVKRPREEQDERDQEPSDVFYLDVHRPKAVKREASHQFGSRQSPIKIEDDDDVVIKEEKDDAREAVIKKERDSST